MAKLQFGLIGCGAIGRTHASCVAKIDDAKFVAYADVNQAAAGALLDEFGGRYATGDVGRVLGDDAIDAVYICTRHDSHAPLAIAAAGAGKHVMMEKPLALTAESCEQMAEAVVSLVMRQSCQLRRDPEPNAMPAIDDLRNSIRFGEAHGQ